MSCKPQTVFSAQLDCVQVWLFWLTLAAEAEFAGVLNVTLKLDEPLSSAA